MKSKMKFFTFVQVIDYILPYDSSFPISRFTFKDILARHSSHHKNVVFLIPRHDRPEQGGKQKISLQVV